MRRRSSFSRRPAEVVAGNEPEVEAGSEPTGTLELPLPGTTAEASGADTSLADGAGQTDVVTAEPPPALPPAPDPVVQLAEYRRRVQVDGGDVEARRGLARLLAARGEHALALEQYEAAREQKPEDPTLVLELAETLVALKRFAPADRELRRLLKFQPGNGAAYLTLGIASFRRGLYAQAEQERSVTEQLPQVAHAFLWRGAQPVEPADEAMRCRNARKRSAQRPVPTTSCISCTTEEPAARGGGAAPGARWAWSRSGGASRRAGGRALRPVARRGRQTPAMRRPSWPRPERASCRRMGEPPVGSALITPAGELRARYLVHVVVRSLTEPVSEATVRLALRNGLRRLQEWGIARVAMPLIDRRRKPGEDVACIMLDEYYDHAVTADYPTTLIIAAADEYELQACQRQLAARELPFLSDAPGPRHGAP
jgi:O-acetyl-ADP-ribose deacetylase (regulator of RNase III)